MDACNLALCFCPTLVGSNPAQDLQMCSIPGGPGPLSRPSTMALHSSDQGTTVAMVLRFCIQHYFDIFEEVVDRSEPLHSPNAAVLSQPDASVDDTQTASTNGSTCDEDESVDDAMLVMPLGPTPPSSALSTPQPAPRSPPTAWRGKHRRVGSGNSSRSAAAPAPASASVKSGRRGSASLGPGGTVTVSRNRTSIISIEKAVAQNGSNAKGLIALGRGTMRTPGGAGVEAVSVTALGFFMPPSDDEDDVTTPTSRTPGH